ncbi:MAG: hypothetical protein K0Q95_2799 [Bacteroidota bacterium]|nr:hypothetical protein [Bacteroidota bacterium]
MKSIRLIIASITLLLAGSLQAQVSVNVNIGSPPQWGPAGYTDVRYYYLPDVEAYYDVQSSMFIYFGNGIWIHERYLPGPYRNYDLYGGYKVVMTDYRGDRPYVYFDEYKVKYKKGYRGKPQKNIGHNPGKGNSNSGHGQKHTSNQQPGNNGSSHKANNTKPANNQHQENRKASPQQNGGGGNDKSHTGGKQGGHGGGGKKK